MSLQKAFLLSGYLVVNENKSKHVQYYSPNRMKPLIQKNVWGKHEKQYNWSRQGYNCSASQDNYINTVVGKSLLIKQREILKHHYTNLYDIFSWSSKIQ